MQYKRNILQRIIKQVFIYLEIMIYEEDREVFGYKKWIISFYFERNTSANSFDYTELSKVSSKSARLLYSAVQ